MGSIPADSQAEMEEIPKGAYNRHCLSAAEATAEDGTVWTVLLSCSRINIQKLLMDSGCYLADQIKYHDDYLDKQRILNIANFGS